MDDHYRHIMKLHRPFLTKNIVWTENLVKALKDEGLLPDSVFRATQVNLTVLTDFRVSVAEG